MEDVARRQVHFEHAHLVGRIFLFRVDKEHVLAFAYRAVHNLEVGNDAPERVEHAVEYQGLQRSVFVARRCRYAFHDGAQYLVHALSCPSRGPDNLFALASQEVYDFVLHHFGHRVDHVAFVQDGYDFQVVFDGHVEVGYGLCLDALCRVHHEQAPFAGCYAAAHLVRKVHVARRVDEVERIFFAVELIFHLYGVAFDGDAPFAFQVHVVEHLALGHLYGARTFQQAVGQRALSVVNVGNDAEVADIFHQMSFS